MASPFENYRFKNVKIKDLKINHFPVPVSDKEEDAGYQELLKSLENEPTPWTTLCEAIRRGDEDMVRKESIHLAGLSTLAAKREAVLVGRPDFLKMLLERDHYIEDNVVATACDLKDRDSVRILLDFGWPIDQPVYFMASLLGTAVNDAKFLQWVIEAGADINVTSKLDESALSIAIARGSMDVVRLLLARGTDVMHGDLLHCAAQRECQLEGAELVDELIKRGADVNAYRYNNAVALRWRVAEALLRHGADPYRKLLNAGELAEPTPLDEALENKDQDLLYLMQTYPSQDRALL